MPKEPIKESIVGFVNSFKLFEQKLDKVQEDVVFQGRILSDLKLMVKKLTEQVQQTQVQRGTREVSPKRKTIKTKSFQGKKLQKKTVLKSGSTRSNIDSMPCIPKYPHRQPKYNPHKVILRSTENKKKLEKGDHNIHI